MQQPWHPPVTYITHRASIILKTLKKNSSMESRGSNCALRNLRENDLSFKALVFFDGGGGVLAKSSNYFFLTLSISPSEQKGIWEAHYRVIISQGRSPLSASELCLICLGRCWRGTQQRRMFMFAAMWNLTALFWHPCIATTPPLSSCVQ